MLSEIMNSLARRLTEGRAAPRAIGALCSTLIAVSLALGSAAIVSCNGSAPAPATTQSYQPTHQQIQQRTQQWAHPLSARNGVTSESVSGIRSDIGFRSRNQMDEHFTKHGAEFGQITEQEYLRLAQTLRDERAGGDVLDISRPDGTVSRYDRTSGAFIAFNADGTIRTLFKPNNGEAYFRRQAMRSH